MKIEEGQTITGVDKVTLLPIGTTATGQAGERVFDGFAWHATTVGYHTYTSDEIGGEVTVTKVGYQPIGLEAYRQLFRTVVIGSVRASSIDTEGQARDALDGLRYDSEDNPPLRPGELWHNRDNLRPIIDGTVMSVGYSGSESFSIYNSRAMNWSRLTGADRSSTVSRIVSVPGEPMWVPEYRDGDERRIAGLRRAAWMVGVQAKRNAEWCPEFEAVMRRLGIEGALVGSSRDVVNMSESEDQPADGSIVAYLNEQESEFIMWQRASGTGVRGYAEVMRTPEAQGRYSSEARVLYNSASIEPMHIPVMSHEMMDLAPVGTVVGQLPDCGCCFSPDETWTKEYDQRWNGILSSSFELGPEFCFVEFP